VAAHETLVGFRAALAANRYRVLFDRLISLATLAILRQRDTRIADLVCADAADLAGWRIKPWRASDQA